MVEERLFGGLTIAEIGEALDMAHRTVDGDWLLARRWLTRELKGGS